MWKKDVKTFCKQEVLKGSVCIRTQKSLSSNNMYLKSTIADALKLKVPSTELLIRSLCASLIWSSISSRKPVQSQCKSSSPVIVSRHLYCVSPWQVHSWALFSCSLSWTVQPMPSFLHGYETYWHTFSMHRLRAPFNFTRQIGQCIWYFWHAEHSKCWLSQWYIGGAMYSKQTGHSRIDKMPVLSAMYHHTIWKM